MFCVLFNASEWEYKMGFLGFGNYARPGKGVKKGEPQKKRFFAFFDLFTRKFFKLIQLNLLYVLFCIPVVTIGPATAALMKIVRYYNEGKPVFLISDFFDAFKTNFKQGFVMSIISAVCIVLSFFSIVFYFNQTVINLWYFIPLALISSITIIVILAHFYTYLLISSVNLKLFSIIKNSVMLAFLGLKSNVFTFIFVCPVIALSILFVPVSLPVVILMTFSYSALVVCYNSFQYIYKYIVRPYYVSTGLPDPYEEIEEEAEPIFEDATI